ncbi:hypothetical protein [Brevibacillus brevis]|uniref:hypothetical protein n=1 Tax=Brevibacillus brevis TaxID=1393 RepID=UPI0037C837EA
MTVKWSQLINQPVGTETIDNINDYTISFTSQEGSPIDLFYVTMRELLSLAKIDFLEQNNTMGPLLLVGMISCAENYFRDVFSKIIRICPVSKACSAEQTIHLGSVVWHGGVEVERGAFEHLSFASSENVKSACKKFLNIEIKKDNSVSYILEEYTKVCELRHGIVHSNAILAGKNAVKLGLTKNGSTLLKIKLGFKEVQECASIITTLVASFNSELFKEIGKRWAIDWRRSGIINDLNEEEYFNLIWGMFFSEIDSQEGNIPNELTVQECLEEVKKEFRLI